MGRIKLKLCIAVFTVFLISIMAAMITVFATQTEANAAAYTETTYEDFLIYSGSKVKYRARLKYYSLIHAFDSNVNIVLETTEIAASSGIPNGPKFSNLKITLTRPDGSTYEYAFEDGKRTEAFSVVLFSVQRIQGSQYLDGTYTIQASGSIKGGATQEQTNSASFIVNRNSPSITLQIPSGDLADDAATNQNVQVTASDRSSVPVLRYSYAKTGGYPTSATTQVASGTTFRDEGYYIITADDNQGLTSTRRFMIDRTAPTILVNANQAGNVSTIYGGTPTLNVTDNLTSADITQCIFNSIAVTESGITIGDDESISVTKGGLLKKSGIYRVEACDRAGNRTSYQFAVIRSVAAYNSDQIGASGFLKTGNYRVRIPYLKTITVKSTRKDGETSKYPGSWSNLNTYIFSSYENALRFMIEVEMEEAVTDNGNKTFTYYQYNNHSATTTYGDTDTAKATMEEFYRALEKYSSAYVSEYSLPSLSSPYVEDSAVIMDEEVLSGKTNSGLQRIGADYVFEDRVYNFSFNGVNYQYTKAAIIRIKYNGMIAYDGKPSSNMNFYGMITSGGASYGNGGVYTIVECDSAGNTTEAYQVYYDRDAPTMNVQYSYYDSYIDSNGDMQSNILTKSINLSSNSQIDGNLKTLKVLELSYRI